MDRRFNYQWEAPEIEEWAANRFDYGDRCIPLGALALGALGAFGIAAFCRPRRYHYYNCYPYFGPPIYSCYPYYYY